MTPTVPALLLLVTSAHAGGPGLWERQALAAVGRESDESRREREQGLAFLKDIYANRLQGHDYMGEAEALTRIGLEDVAKAQDLLWGPQPDAEQAARSLAEADQVLQRVQDHYVDTVSFFGRLAMETGYGRAVVAWHTGRSDDARRHLRRALEIEPSDPLAPMALLLSGDLALARGDRAQAEFLYLDAAERLDPATAQWVREAVVDFRTLEQATPSGATEALTPDGGGHDRPVCPPRHRWRRPAR